MPITPLGASNILQTSTVGVQAGVSSVSLTLPANTSSGSHIVALVRHDRAATTPTGFALDASGGTAPILVSVFRRGPTEGHTGGESSWTLNLSGGTGTVQWIVYEITGILNSPLYDTASSQFNGNTTNQQTNGGGSNPNPALNDCIYLGVFSLRSSVDPAGLTVNLAPVTGSHAYVAKGDSGWSTSTVEASRWLRSWFGASFPYPFAGENTVSPSATASGNSSLTGVNDLWRNLFVAYKSSSTSRPVPLLWHTGFEHGTYGGLVTAPTAATRIMSSVTGTLNTDILIQAGSARTGSFGCRVIQAAAAKFVRVDSTKFGTGKTEASFMMGVKVVSVTTDPAVVFEVNPAAGTILQFIYDTSQSQFGLRWGSGGTISYQTQTVATGTWAWIDLSVSGIGGTTWTASWSIDGAEEDGPADLTGQTASTISSFNWGGNVSQTISIDIDDVGMTDKAAEYPLGKHKHVLLTPSGGVFVNGSSANFQQFTANGTLAALNTSTAGSLLDEVPPNLSGTSDGVVQITAATADLTFDMSTYTLATGEVVDGLSYFYALWANSAQNATLEILNGTLLTTATAFNPGNAPTAISATAPMWVHGNYRSQVTNPAGLLQTSIDGLGAGFGNSNDATPDIGAVAIYVELAVGETRVVRVYGPDQDGLTVDETQAAAHYGAVAYDVTAGATRAATLRYVKDGVEITRPVAAGATLNEPVNTTFRDQVSQVTVDLDPLPWPEV